MAGTKLVIFRHSLAIWHPPGRQNGEKRSIAKNAKKVVPYLFSPIALSDIMVNSVYSGWLTIATQASGSFLRWPIKCPSIPSNLLKIKKSDEPSAKLILTNGCSSVDLSSIKVKDGTGPKKKNKYRFSGFWHILNIQGLVSEIFFLIIIKN